MSTVLGLLVGVVVGALGGAALALMARIDNTLAERLHAYGLTRASAPLLGRAARVLRAVDAEAQLPPAIAAHVAGWLADYDTALARPPRSRR